jgi:putative drug exporter of the RND superfamily
MRTTSKSLRRVPTPPDGSPPAGTGRLARIPGGHRTRWLVLLAWVAIIVVAGPFAGSVGEVEDNDAVSFLPRSAEATQVEQLLTRFPQDDVIPAVVVYARDGGLTAADRAAVEAQRQRLRPHAAGGDVAAPAVSADARAATLAVPLPDTDDIVDRVGALRTDVSTGLPPGLQVLVGGPAGDLTDSVEVFGDLDRNLLLVTVSVVALLLLLTYRSPVLWLLPLLAVGLASQLANAAVYLFGKHAGLPVDGQSAGILTVLVFGVGTDYALLLIARYREELHHHADRHVAMAVALRRAGPAIVASAGTVTVGLLCLLLADLNSNRSLGGVGALGVLAGLLAMVTLLPVLLTLVGRWAFWPFIPRAGTPVLQRRGSWAWVGGKLAGRPRRVWIGTAAVLAGVATAAGGLQVGLTQEESYTTTPESVTAQRVLAAHFPAGSGAPTDLVAAGTAAGAVAAAARDVAGVADVRAAERSTDGALVRLPVVLADAPDSDAAKETVRRLRSAVHAVPDAGALVGGPTAITIDTAAAADRDRRVVIPLVLVVVLAILVALLRAVVAPLLLMATVVLSFFAALGASRLLLDGGFGIEAVDQSTPLLGFVFLVALGVDYNIFLVHRVREEVARHGHRNGVLRALAATGGVITSAGLVLAGTFAVLGSLPLVMMVGLGVLVAVGVLLDAFVVRSVLVPALLLDAGRRSWWPGRLQHADP